MMASGSSEDDHMDDEEICAMEEMHGSDHLR